MTPRRAGGTGPRGVTVGSLSVGNLFAAIGLVVVALLSVTLLTGNLPVLTSSDGGDGGKVGPIQTATPSNVVIVDPRTNVAGTILYVKAGNIWLQHGDKATALTSGGHDAMPSFTADGAWIYFIRTVDETGSWRISGASRRYRLATPTLMRVKPDGSAEPEALLTGRIKSGSRLWSYFLRQPVVSPNGSTIVVVSDGPDPAKSDVVLKSFDTSTGKLTALKAPEIAPLGHQDPAWSPDGHYLLFVKNARDGSRGAPAIMRYDTSTQKSVAITGPGYSSPSWSPDGRYIAATRTTAFGTDVVILEASHGSELLRVTNDESSFDPVWSPAGDAIAYLSLSGGVTDLWSAGIVAGATPTLGGAPLQLTIAAGLDAASRPGWWIPADELPTLAPTVAPTTSPSASGSAPAASTTP